ncbi:amino acid permease/ SLC12A domain-containing protein [Xylariaceae sp. FL0016]|nr:amino acid permease/ SLC12A domain-containing protein [Xylariaceae sp. FL0016]
MALSSSIGAGLLLSTSQSLAVGGPAPLFMAFAIVGLAVWISMCSLGELSTNFPNKGSFYEYSVRFISPAWGFSMGWNYAINFIFIVPFELIVMVMCARYWNPEIPAYYLLPIFLLGLVLIYAFGAEWYAEAENFFGICKMLVLTTFVLTAILIATHSIPSDKRPQNEVGVDLWKHEAFKNNGPGFLFTFMAAGMAYGGTEMMGFTAAESKDPRRVMRLASYLVFGRIVLFYLLPTLMLGFVLKISLDPNSSEQAMISPFVQAVKEASIPVLLDIMNAIIIVSIFSMASAGIFASSRSIRAISAAGMGPKFCTKLYKGRPVGALAVVFFFSLLAFVKAAPQGDQVFHWLLALASASNYFTWGSICLAQIRCRLAIQKRGLDVGDVLSYQSPFGIWGSVIAILVFGFGLVAQVVAAFKSPLVNPPPAFASMLGIVVVFVFWAGYTLIKDRRTFIVPLDRIDLEGK